MGSTMPKSPVSNAWGARGALVERLHLSVDRSGARPYERAVVDVDGHGEGEHPHAPRHVHDDVHKESFEGPRHPCRAEITEDVGEQRHLGILRASVEAEGQTSG